MEPRELTQDDLKRLERLRSFVVSRRLMLNLTQRELADLAGIPRGSYASFESGKEYFPRRKLLDGIAKAIGVPYEDLDRAARGLPPRQLPEEIAENLAKRILLLSPDNQEIIGKVLDGLLSSQVHQVPEAPQPTKQD